MPLRLGGIVLVVVMSSASAVGLEHPLQIAWQLQESRYADWTYGADAERQQINCVQFLEDLIEELLLRRLSPWERDKILIQNISKSENLQKLVDKGDVRTRGIQHALLAMGRGKIVSPKFARPGDFVQYWYKKDNAWVGHVAIIQQVTRERGFSCAYIYGAHESLNAVGVAGYMVTLNDPHMKVYIVRFR
jgi:hypothetical protein